MFLNFILYVESIFIVFLEVFFIMKLYFLDLKYFLVFLIIMGSLFKLLFIGLCKKGGWLYGFVMMSKNLFFLVKWIL